MGGSQHTGALSVQRLGSVVVNAVDPSASEYARRQLGRYKLLHGIGPAHARTRLVQEVGSRRIAHAHDYAVAGNRFLAAGIGLSIGH